MRRWATAERARDAATLLPFAAAALFLPPFILLFAVPARLFGVPLIVVYTFGAWAGIVMAAWLVARRHAFDGFAADAAPDARTETSSGPPAGDA